MKQDWHLKKKMSSSESKMKMLPIPLSPIVSLPLHQTSKEKEVWDDVQEKVRKRPKQLLNYLSAYLAHTEPSPSLCRWEERETCRSNPSCDLSGWAWLYDLFGMQKGCSVKSFDRQRALAKALLQKQCQIQGRSIPYCTGHVVAPEVSAWIETLKE